MGWRAGWWRAGWWRAGWWRAGWWRAGWWRAGWWRAGWWRAGAALLLLAALLPRVPLHSHLASDFPHLTPHELAHFLADFSNYPKLYPDLESWTVEEEAGNYTWWRYSVSYTCGARCSGRADVWHAAGDAAGGYLGPCGGTWGAWR
ncbi:unnamed protein product [Parnassius apollo]|uniref:(apollo) hypothetical protein n=1 Tax=Parnassius apollo TaxID=110799 RepID=A0A8S3XIC8_PARAO|nr:unnamed protein product [Parnassius apollo]